MESVEAAQDYVRHAIASDRAGARLAFLEALGIAHAGAGEKTPHA
jgi:hypothetical protein